MHQALETNERLQTTIKPEGRAAKPHGKQRFHHYETPIVGWFQRQADNIADHPWRTAGMVGLGVASVGTAACAFEANPNPPPNIIIGGGGQSTPDTGTPTPTTKDLLSLLPTDAQLLLSTDAKDANARATLINKLQTDLISDSTRLGSIETGLNSTLKFGVNGNETASFSGKIPNYPKFKGSVDDLTGFAVVGINCQVTTSDGTVHELLLTTQDQSLKTGWVAIDTTPLQRNYTNGLVLGGSYRKGGDGYATTAWSSTIGDLIAVIFPDKSTTNSIDSGALTTAQAKEYKQLENYLLNHNNTKPASVISDINQSALSTTPAKYWGVVAFPNN